MSARILVVDDEIGMQAALREVLSRQGYHVTIAPDGLAALSCLDSQNYDLLLTDVRMPEITGMELLDRVRGRWPEMPVLVMTAYGTIEDAVEAMKKGAADYLLKPFSSETIERLVKRLLERRLAVPSANSGAEDEQDAAKPYGTSANPIAVSQGMRQVLELSDQVADSVATILIQGESGTGKEVVARYIHNHSGRRNSPFVAVNCAALPEGLLESELFGHEKGAFTGAVLSRKGKFELANHGTLLLDEVSEMPLALQAKLLRVLQEREIDPIGAQRSVPLDVRVIATTNRNLAEYVEEGNFREDLFYRLQVIMVSVPPLREHREDILPLSEFFVRRHCRVNRRPKKRLSQAMREHLLNQNWRGNVRELENFLERAVLLCQSDEITPEGIFLSAYPQPLAPAACRAVCSAGFSPSSNGSGAPFPERVDSGHRACPAESEEPALLSFPRPGELMTLEEMERRMIMQTLEQVGGNRTRAADLLGVSVRTIRNKLNLYGIASGSPEKEKAVVGV